VKNGSRGDSYTYSSSGHAWRLAVEIVLSGDSCRGSECKGTWRLAVRVPHQVVWQQVSLSGSGAAPGENTMVATLLLWMCVIYNALVISRSSTCWCSLRFGSERIPRVVARDRG